MSDFDIKKFLIENKLTYNSRVLVENLEYKQDPLYTQRPELTLQTALQLVEDYIKSYLLDQPEKWREVEPGAGITYKGDRIGSPIGDPIDWTEEEWGYDIILHAVEDGRLSKWGDALTASEYGEDIFEEYIREFLQIVGQVEFRKEYHKLIVDFLRSL